ncbi:hypothetical protein GCM10010129_03080 [Streptomyces fumigatiscleroticus]|nr:hypothetical protein GCM10010129_03080 [Streptomyces fumigatiscleroticus]
MKKSPYALAAVAAVAVLSAPPAVAAAGPARMPLDITARQCIQGGGIIIISANGTGADGYVKFCQGGTHDGETIV